jgi:hypothetical protein
VAVGGTTDTVTKFTSSTTIGDSTITDDGTTIGLGNSATVDVTNGAFDTGGGDIDTSGGTVNTTGGNINTNAGNINTGGGNVDIGSGVLQGSIPGSQVNVDTVNATTKNFDIEHPTKKDPWRLRYSVLEGPENGVYVRGEIKDTNIIELPKVWIDLVDKNSLTINLTPIGSPTIYYVEKIDNNKIYIGSNSENKHLYYTVFAERKDVNKLVIEYIKK